MLRFIITGVVFGSFAIAACGDDGGGADDDPFDTFQACYDDHHVDEGLSNKEAITVCCLDHPIAGSKGTFCKDTEADCEVALRAGLDGSVSDAQITEGCTDYIAQKNM